MQGLGYVLRVRGFWGLHSAGDDFGGEDGAGSDLFEVVECVVDFGAFNEDADGDGIAAVEL